MKKLDDKAGDKKEVMHIYDSHMTCEECGDTRHSGNHCPEVHEDVNYINNNNYYYYYNHPQQNQGWNQQRPTTQVTTQVTIKVTILTTTIIISTPERVSV